MIITIFAPWVVSSHSVSLSVAVFTPTLIGHNVDRSLPLSNGRLKQQITWLVLGRRLKTAPKLLSGS